MKKRVLFADNHRDFLDAWSEELERAGFEVLKATSVEEAEQILHDYWVHLAILDLRLRDDNDPKDISGLTLARKEIYRTIPKIILTRFTRYNDVRDALGPALEGLPPAVDYISKLEETEMMMQALERAFTEFVRINWDLVIRWKEHNSFFNLADLIEKGTDSVRIRERTHELEDLFRQLFYKSSQITFGRLLTGNEGQVILEVFAYGEEGQEGQFLVSCGQKERITEEDRRYEAFAPKRAGHGGTLKLKTVETMRFAATAYRLIEGDLEEISTFAKFYRANSAERITLALDHLFSSTLEPWYQRGQFHEEKKTLNEFFLEELGFQDETLFLPKLEVRLEAICQEALTTGLARLHYSSYKLTLHWCDGSSIFYPNPISCLSEIALVSPSTVIWGITHGRLAGNSILTNSRGQTWLIDFSQSSRGPLIRDFVSLEMALKFELLTTLDLQARYEMECRLATVSRLDEEISLDGLEAETQKALQSINHLRRQAAPVIGHHLNTYLNGLLFGTMAQLAGYDPEVHYTRREFIPYLHNLLSAMILGKKLTPSLPEGLPDPAYWGLWIDQANKKVWVESRPVHLTSQEFDFLLYLYQHRGELCSREDIVKHVFEADYKDDVSGREISRLEDARLNSTKSRLLKKIEPDPDNPKYIIAIRGEGYKLELADDRTE